MTKAELNVNDSVAVTLADVNVTTIKQSHPLREVAGASTILTQSELEELNAVTMRGISDVVPNFYMPEYGSRITSTIYVRGIGARMDQPSVGLNVDNVPYLNKDAYDFDIADISSVEMLRGPQSTLYGRNTMAGVINITTLSPMRFQGLRFLLEGASGGRLRFNGGWYHKFNERAALSLSAGYASGTGFFVNEYNGKKADHEKNWSGRMKFHWRASEALTLQNVASAGYLRQGGYPYESVVSGKIAYNDTCFYHRFTFADGFTARYSGESFVVTSITSVQHINDNLTLDQDFLPLDYFTLTQKKRDTALTEDVVVKSRREEEGYGWLTGFFAFYKHLDMNAPVTFRDKGISELIENHRNDANPTFPIEWDGRSFALNSDFGMPTWGLALYHESEFNFRRWSLTAGIRVDYERSTLNYHSYCDTGYTIYRVTEEEREEYRHVPIDIDDRGNLAKDFCTVLPKLGVSYSFPEIGNVYVNVSKGYKAGGFNTQMFSDVLQQRLMGIMGIGAQYDIADVVSYRPEKSWNFEGGAHLDIFSKRLSLDVAAFYIDCRDQQLTMFPDGTTTGRIMTNAGKTRSVGGEISATWLGEGGFSFTGSYGYTNARFKKFFNGINDFKGKYLPYAPRNTLFLQALWAGNLTRSNDGPRLTVAANMRGTGEIFWNEDNSRRQPFYALVGADATLEYKNFSVQLWGKNLTGTKYYTFYFMSMGNEFLQRGRGPEYGLTIRYVL